MTQPFITDRVLIQDWLYQYCTYTGSLTISDEGRVSTNGSILFKTITESSFTQFAVEFDTIEGDFYCGGCGSLQTLHGAPKHVGRTFSCTKGKSLLTLEGAPLTLGENFSCWQCDKLTSLKGVNAVAGYLSFTAKIQPDPEVTRTLLQNRIQLHTPQDIPWINLVNDYRDSGDLLTAIAQFEDYFGIPYHATISNPDMPHGHLTL